MSTSLSGDDTLDLPEFDAPPPDPMTLVQRWLDLSEEHEVSEPLSMTLATASADGVVSARTVDVKTIDEDGLVFGTSDQSRKGADLAENPSAALQVYWRETMQQLRFEGRAIRLSDADSDGLFTARSPKSRAATAVSRQSAPFSATDPEQGIDRLLADANALLDEHGDDVPRPPTWAAYRLVPSTVEFWKGSRDRMHRRIRYTATETGWAVERLQP